MTTVIVFVALAVLGTLVRALVTAHPPVGEVPWRTLAANSVGAAVLGFLVARPGSDPSIAVTVAGLGSLTTFSTVAGEVATLLDDRHRRTAIAYVGCTVLVGIAAAWLGLEIGAAQ